MATRIKKKNWANLRLVQYEEQLGVTREQLADILGVCRETPKSWVRHSRIPKMVQAHMRTLDRLKEQENIIFGLRVLLRQLKDKI